FHGTELYDDYTCMRDDSRKEKAVMDLIRAENAYSLANMSSLTEIENNILKEITSRVDFTDVSVPVKDGDYYYYSRDIKEGQYPLQCRKYLKMDVKEEVILDLNEIAKGSKYFELGEYSISPDHHYLAYSVDTTGDENYSLYVKNLKTGKLFGEVIEKVSQVVWAELDDTFFYTTVDESNRTNSVWMHIVGTNEDTDTNIFLENDESYFMWIQKTKDKKFILIGTASYNTSEMYYLDSTDPMGDFELISPREEGVEYYVEHQGTDFLIYTNADGAYNFKIMKTKDSESHRNEWKEYVGHSEDTYIGDFEIFNKYMVLSEIKDGKKVIGIIDHLDQSSKEIKFDDNCYNVYLDENPEYDTEKLRYMYESLVSPYSVVDYDMKTGKREILKQQKVVGGYDETEYGTEMIYALSHDNKNIPISLVYKKSLLKNDGSNPILLDGYGAYGDFFNQDFSIPRISLLDRGVIYAIAHVRGGIEKGKQWHIEGMLKNKKNTFKDFISCAEYLIEKRYTSSDKLVITGASAGGLLVGAVLNERPDIFKAAILDVPFVDVINTMADPSLTSVVTEYDEWGNPAVKEDFEYMLSYDPYQNIVKQPYPEILVRAGFYDPRVNFWEQLKWVSKIRENNTAETKVLLSIGMTGHSGYSGKYDLYREIANTYSFILYHMGINR
ncbi:MAG: prolyl oligopeptidase family serine peptidase, partial [Candidatus Delongbacteria bacterium]|nr:prolyl oligopeptidase family serine peptidase [Candidatus Delongbacteria bacterium]